jgi:sulfur-carrier protein
MNIKLKLFSIAKDLAGFEERVLHLQEGASAEAVLDELELLDPRFSDLCSSVRVAVNYTYVTNDHLLHDGDEVAVIPPVSGG